MHRRHLIWSLAAFPLALGTGLAPGPSRAQGDGWPREVVHEAGTLTLRAAPQRIVSTSPSLTGTLLAIGVPVQATAATTRSALTDDKGFFRQWAAVADARGVGILYPDRNFDIEALMVAAPDLVIGSATGADSILPYLAEAEALGLPVLVLDYSSQGWQEVARKLGRATGHEAGAEAAIRDFGARAAAAAAGLRLPPGPVNIVGYDIGGTYSIGQTASPQAQVLAALGFTVVPLPDHMRGAITRATDGDFISRENLAAAITADTVFLLRGDEAQVAAFLADPLLANLPAVKAGAVHPLGLSSFRVDYYSALEMIETVAAHFRA